MRNLIYYVACTIDGFIARQDGRFDFFLSEGEHLDYLLTEFPETVPDHLRDVLGVQGENRHFDTVLMGRKTYEVGTAIGVTNPYPQMRQIVISRSISVCPDPSVELVNNDPIGAVRRLKQDEGLDIWLCGGADLAAELFPEIDEIIVKVNPIVLGAGLPLFGRGLEPARLDLIDLRVFDNGVFVNHYRVRREY